MRAGEDPQITTQGRSKHNPKAAQKETYGRRGPHQRLLASFDARQALASGGAGGGGNSGCAGQLVWVCMYKMVDWLILFYVCA